MVEILCFRFFFLYSFGRKDGVNVHHDSLKSQNRLLSFILISIAFLNVIMLFFLGKSITLIMSIFLLASFGGILTFSLSQLNFDKAASYFYAFVISGIIQVYSILDQTPETLLFLFVTVAMCSLYFDWKVVLFSTILAIGQTINDYFHFTFLFPQAKPLQSLCYYLFSFASLGMILAFACYFFKKQLNSIR